MLQPVSPAIVCNFSCAVDHFEHNDAIEKRLDQRAGPPGVLKAHHGAGAVAWVCSMETLIWLGISAAVLLLVWAAAPYHARMVDNRDTPSVETWD
jgi:hypothetical protein